MEAETLSPIIDCDIEPTLPSGGWRIKSHTPRGKVVWDIKRVELWLSEDQKSHPGQPDPGLPGTDVYEKLKLDTGYANACLLDYLLERQDELPQAWKKLKIFFWGTLYDHPIGQIGVRFLYFNAELQCFASGVRHIAQMWGTQDPALLIYDYEIPSK